MADALVYASPWDFEDDDRAAGRAAGLGVEGVAVAASYHAARAARPLHPSVPLVDAEHAACYVPVLASAWRGRRLVPRRPTWVRSADSFGLARQSLAAVGLPTWAWVVLTHNSDLGRSHPDLVVRNAFGTGYPYALCPSAPDVVEYCTTLVEQVLDSGPVDGLVLEACGPMGLEHNGPHEKTSLAGWDRVQRELLSLCFCTACTARCAATGLDVAELRRLVRRAVGPEPASPPPDSVEQALGDDLAGPVRDVRSGVAAELRRHVTAAATRSRPGLPVTLHAAPSPWATGSFATVAPSVDAPVDALVASCFEADAGADALAGLRRPAADRSRLGAFLRPTQDWEDEQVRRTRLREYRAAGMDQLHLYHLGMVGPRGLQVLRSITEDFRQG